MFKPDTVLKWHRELVKQRLSSSILMFKPDTVLKWHRELVKRKWNYRQDQIRGGRPKIDTEIEQLLMSR